MPIVNKGDLVLIKHCHNSKRVHGLDSEGIMESMVGHTFIADYGGERSCQIKSPKSEFVFTWNTDDLKVITEDDLKDPEPIIFKFDEQQLQI